ncbi:hypothetical protein J6590_041448 [Homalodisca vitripennis]|nr:hypothetical protein J6590_041448 [Homalodisca vitripennis]
MKKTVKKSKKTLQKIANPKGKSNFRKTNSKIRPDIKQEKKRCRKNLSFDTSSDDDGDGFTCNDDEMDDLEPMKASVVFVGNSGKTMNFGIGALFAVDGCTLSVVEQRPYNVNFAYFF